MPSSFTFPQGVEQVLWNTTAPEGVGRLVDHYGYERVVVVSSRTLQRTTAVVDDICDAISHRLVGRTDRVGEHAPLSNVIRGIEYVRELRADAIVAIGGGSILDFGKAVQLGISEDVDSADGLRRFAVRNGVLPAMSPHARIRQIAVPTTLSTAEWTASGTPVDDETGVKIPLTTVLGTPRAIVYDASLLRHTPRDLLLATGIRGLDHAMNTVLSTDANDLATVLALQAISRYPEALRAIARDPLDVGGLALAQQATWFTGLTQSTVAHGFSHYMVHVLAPWAKIGHSEAACVMMLAQARWMARETDDRLRLVSRALGDEGERVDVLLERLLVDLGLPTSMGAIGVDPHGVDDLLDLAVRHPFLVKHNLRPIETRTDIARVLELVS